MIAIKGNNAIIIFQSLPESQIVVVHKHMTQILPTKYQQSIFTKATYKRYFESRIGFVWSAEKQMKLSIAELLSYVPNNEYLL